MDRRAERGEFSTVDRELEVLYTALYTDTALITVLKPYA